MSSTLRTVATRDARARCRKRGHRCRVPCWACVRADWRRFNDLLFCVFTGLRWTEATGIRTTGHDFQRRIIMVPKGVGKRDRNLASLIPKAPILVEPLRARAAIGQVPLIRDVPSYRMWRRNIEVCGIFFETDRGLCVASSLRPTSPRPASTTTRGCVYAATTACSSSSGTPTAIAYSSSCGRVWSRRCGGIAARRRES